MRVYKETPVAIFRTLPFRPETLREEPFFLRLYQATASEVSAYANVQQKTRREFGRDATCLDPGSCAANVELKRLHHEAKRPIFEDVTVFLSSS